MKRRIYDSPTTQVVQLEHQARLLNGSYEAERRAYGEAQTEIWGE